MWSSLTFLNFFRGRFTLLQLPAYLLQLPSQTQYFSTQPSKLTLLLFLVDKHHLPAANQQVFLGCIPYPLLDSPYISYKACTKDNLLPLVKISSFSRKIKSSKDGVVYTILTMENKRRLGEGQDAIWAEALRKLDGYLDLVPKKQKPNPKFEVGLTGVRQWVRFCCRQNRLSLSLSLSLYLSLSGSLSASL